MASPLNFSCFRTKQSIFTNRLYVGLKQNKLQIENTVFSYVNGKEGSKKTEKKGLGMTEYGNILGRFLTLIGYAFKIKDEEKNDLYINKKSFCNLIHRLNKNNKKNNFFNVFSIEEDYKSKKTIEKKQELKKIYNTFNAILPNFSDKNIADISIELLGKI